jgi:hypothetical protein
VVTGVRVGTAELLFGEHDRRQALVSHIDFDLDLARAPHMRAHSNDIAPATELQMRDLEALGFPRDGAKSLSRNLSETRAEGSARGGRGDVTKRGKAAISNHVSSSAKLHVERLGSALSGEGERSLSHGPTYRAAAAELQEKSRRRDRKSSTGTIGRATEAESPRSIVK